MYVKIAKYLLSSLQIPMHEKWLKCQVCNGLAGMCKVSFRDGILAEKFNVKNINKVEDKTQLET